MKDSVHINLFLFISFLLLEFLNKTSPKYYSFQLNVWLKYYYYFSELIFSDTQRPLRYFNISDHTSLFIPIYILSPPTYYVSDAFLNHKYIL